ncbi:MAG TPA: hypothetical protein VIL99_18650 [Ignavibacteria bacterium]
MVNFVCKRNFIYSIVILSSISLLTVVLLNLFTQYKIEPISVFSGWILSLANVLLGTKFIVKAIDKDNKRFFTILFGSMVVRLFVTLIFVLIGLLVFKLNEMFFVFSLFGFYFAFIAIEIIFLNCFSKIKKLSA